MVKVKLRNGRDWAVNKNLKKNVDILINDMKNSEMDIVIVIDGLEGTGKSFMARGLGMYCATKLNCDFSDKDIHFTTDSYIKSSLEAGCFKFNGGNYKINVLDEGRNAINRKRSTSASNVRFTNYLSECRALQQVHIILAPAFHDLDQYVILWRMSMLIHSLKAYAADKDNEVGVKLARGNYKVFINHQGMKKAFVTCYEIRGYQYPHKFEIHDRWCGREVFTPKQLEEYDKKKYAATLQKYFDEQKEKEELAQMNTDGVITAKEAAKILGISTHGLSDRIRNKKIPAIKIGNFWHVKKALVKDMIEGKIKGGKDAWAKYGGTSDRSQQ